MLQNGERNTEWMVVGDVVSWQGGILIKQHKYPPFPYQNRISAHEWGI